MGRYIKKQKDLRRGGCRSVADSLVSTRHWLPERDLCSKKSGRCSFALRKIGLEKAKKVATKHGVSIHCIHADLEHFDIGTNQWDGIVSIFCHVPLQLRESLHRKVTQAPKRGGIFLLEAYTPKQLDYGTGGPPVAEQMMSKATLEQELAGLQIDYLEELEREVIEGSHHTGLGAVVQAIAVNPLRHYQVSSNRGSATHKLRYVESGGGESDPNCTLCKSAITPRED